jgi:hypothetical protein
MIAIRNEDKMDIMVILFILLVMLAGAGLGHE